MGRFLACSQGAENARHNRKPGSKPEGDGRSLSGMDAGADGAESDGKQHGTQRLPGQAGGAQHAAGTAAAVGRG